MLCVGRDEKLTKFKYDGVRARLANINYPCITHFYLPDSGNFEIFPNEHKKLLKNELLLT